MKASVIIPYRDRSDHLQLVIEALTNQSMNANDYEIIVVDDGSIQPISFTPSTVKLITVPHRGIAAASNTGMVIAKGEILIFLDCDIVVDPLFVETHYHFCVNHQQTVGLGSRWHMDPSGTVKAYDTRLKLLTRYGKQVSDLIHPWFMTYTCNVSLTKELAMAEVFDEYYKAWGLEDSEWAYRLHRRGCLFSFIENLTGTHLYHDRTMTLEKYLGWETNLSYTVKKHPELIVLECFKDVFNPQIKADYFEAYDIFEGILCKQS